MAINYTGVSLDDKLSILAHFDGVGLRGNYKGMKLSRADRDANKDKPVYQFDIKGNLLLIHATAEDAINDLGIHKASLYRNLEGKIKTVAGYRFSYEDHI